MKTGVLLLHGFSGGPYEVEPFAQFLRTQTDWLIEVPTLSGHGDPDDLYIAGYTAFDWLRDAEYSFIRLQRKVDRVIVVGFSMGGVLAIHLASKFQVDQVVLLSAAMKYIALPQLAKDMWAIAKEVRNKSVANDELYKRYESKLKKVPIQSTLEFIKVVNKVRVEMHKMRSPVYIVQGAKDGIVPASTAQFLFDRLQSSVKWMYISESGKHHICFSEDCERWFMHVLKKLRE